MPLTPSSHHILSRIWSVATARPSLTSPSLYTVYEHSTQTRIYRVCGHAGMSGNERAHALARALTAGPPGMPQPTPVLYSFCGLLLLRNKSKAFIIIQRCSPPSSPFLIDGRVSCRCTTHTFYSPIYSPSTTASLGCPMSVCTLINTLLFSAWFGKALEFVPILQFLIFPSPLGGIKGTTVALLGCSGGRLT